MFFTSLSHWGRNNLHGFNNYTRVPLHQELAQTAKQTVRESTQKPTRIKLRPVSHSW